MSHPYQDVRYTDSMVRANPELHNAAVQWALGYTGDFEPMVKARLQAEATGTLTVLSARTVLNCARSDPQWAAAAAWYFPEAPRPVPLRSVLIAARPPERKVVIKLRATFHMRYAISTNWAARYAHILDHNRSELRYVTANEQYWPLLYGKCHKRLSEHYVRLVDDPGDWPVCRRCLEAE